MRRPLMYIGSYLVFNFSRLQDKWLLEGNFANSVLMRKSPKDIVRFLSPNISSDISN